MNKDVCERECAIIYEVSKRRVMALKETLMMNGGKGALSSHVIGLGWHPGGQ